MQFSLKSGPVTSETTICKCSLNGSVITKCTASLLLLIKIKMFVGLSGFHSASSRDIQAELNIIPIGKASRAGLKLEKKSN